MIAIVCSRADEASEHVVEHVLAEGEFEEFVDDSRPDAEGGGTCYRSAAFELRYFDDLHLYLDGVADAFDDPDLLLFASRHSGETGPLLSAHPTGNFGPAEYGGEDGTLAAAPPNALAAVLDRLAEHAPEGYDVGMECTHHGPSDVGVPSLFVELGSGPDEWADPEGARAVARAILDLADGEDHVAPYAPREGGARRHVVGFGGGHYAPRFTRIARETDWGVGHVAADWCLDAMGDPDPDVIAAAFEESAAEYAVVEGTKPDLEATVEDLGYRVVSETWVRETGGVPLPIVDLAEDALGRIEDGTRFGDSVREGVDGDLRIAALPDGLLDAAQGVDREAVLAALDEHCVAYDTSESGTRAGDRALVRDAEALSALTDRLVELLRERYDEVTREDGAVVAEETGFDPALAAEAGVPEGPAFGRLANGESVEVDGETVDPADVSSRSVDRFDLPAIEETVPGS